MLSYPATIPLSTRSLFWLSEQIRVHAARYARGGGWTRAARRCWCWPICAAGTPRPAGRRVRHRTGHGVLVCDRARRPDRHVRTDPRCGGGEGGDAGVGDPGRHADPDRPGSRAEAVLQRAQAPPRRQRAVPRRRPRPAAVDLGGVARPRHFVACLADKAYQAAGPTIAVPFKGRRLSVNQRAVNRSIAKARALGERAAATLKTWRTLAKLRCCPHRVTPLLAAITVLQHVEEDRRWPR